MLELTKRGRRRYAVAKDLNPSQARRLQEALNQGTTYHPDYIVRRAANPVARSYQQGTTLIEFFPRDPFSVDRFVQYMNREIRDL